MPAAFATAVITRDGNRGQLNVSPEISPDGSRIMFFSERDLFSIDLYLADARTGKVIRKITDTATDPHFESLQFLSSAGAWDSAGKRFVFPGISKGEPVLTIVNADNGKREREIRLADLHEVLNPTWSPDGNVIAFSGLVGGLTDLFAYDLTTSTHAPADDRRVRRARSGLVARRPLARVQHRPVHHQAGRSWSPGTCGSRSWTSRPGRSAKRAGSTARRTSARSGRATAASLYFLSDRQGITNIYRRRWPAARRRS